MTKTRIFKAAHRRTAELKPRYPGARYQWLFSKVLRDAYTVLRREKTTAILRILNRYF